MAPIKHSQIWTFFSKDDNITRCNECKKVLKANFGNTSNLKRHLEHQHQECFKKLKAAEADMKPNLQANNLPSTSNASQPTLPAIISRKQKMSPDCVKAKKVTNILLQMICVDYQPFSFVQDSGFVSLLSELLPEYQVPSRQLFSRKLVPELYEKKKACVAKLLSENFDGIAITTDGWTSRSTDSYLALTAHIIKSNMTMVSVCLAVHPIAFDHTAENLTRCLQEILTDYHILSKTTKIFVITDNARNMLNAVNNLTPHVEGRSCFAHTLQLAINNALKAFPGIVNVLAKCRTIVGHFKKSTKSSIFLQKTQVQLGLPQNKLKQDVATRFNSTFYMLSRLVEQRKAITLVLANEDTPVSNLTPNDWKTAEQLIDTLKPFEEVTVMLSAETYPTLSMVIPAIHQLQEGLESCDLNDFGKRLLENMKNRWPNIKNDLVYSCATMLDPRFKLVGFSTQEKDKVVKSVTDTAVKIVEVVGETSTIPSTQHMQEGKKSIWSSFQKKVENEYTKSDIRRKNDVRREIELYLQESPIPVSISSKPLIWWNKNVHIYPNLAKVARCFLCIPATSVPSERLFSSAGEMHSKKRCSLRKSLLEQLVFLNANWSIET